MNFSEWITQKYVEWRGDAIGKERSITDFSQTIGVSQQIMSLWMNGSIPKRQSTISKLYKRFGVEVYDVLGLERPEPATEVLFEDLPEEFRADLQAALEDANQQYKQAAERGVRLTEEEASRILHESVSKYGFSSNDT